MKITFIVICVFVAVLVLKARRRWNEFCDDIEKDEHWKHS